MPGKVAILMGSKSDIPLVEKAEEIFRQFEVACETHVLSAHRTPNKVRKFALQAEQSGIDTILAVAGLAAHLPGVLASLTTIPVIGVPAGGGPLSGQDALYSIVQMPPGIPVASVGIGNAKNAALYAAQMLALKYPGLRDKVKSYRSQFGDDAD
ncbi:MAG: 5-(carboxyamino)imidazole ribonucleotide mutase [Chitinivibrionales bacterium]|nr:5-(carboxyamino)imidazole ribonucleotide mutase [Chitinivibrionales bacterium]